VNRTLLRVAGGLNLACAALDFAFGVLYLAYLGPALSGEIPLFSGVMTAMGVFCFILGAFILAGGIFARLARGWVLAFTSSIFALHVPLLGLAPGVLLVWARQDWSKTIRGVVWGVLGFLGFLSVCFWAVASML